MSNQRIKRVQKALASWDVDAIIITNPIDLLYLTQLDISSGTLVITKKKAVLGVDGRYLEKCQKMISPAVPAKNKMKPQNGAKDASPGQGSPGRGERRSLRKNELAGTAVTSLEIVRLTSEILVQLLDKVGKRIGFSSDTTNYAAFLSLQQELGKERELVPLFKPIEKIRAIKEPKEIRAIEKACQLAMRGYEFLCTRLYTGVSEKALAKELELFWIIQGADRLAFEPIIAFGKNSSMPHYRAGSSLLAVGDPVLVDIGVVVDGYASDMTRMIFYGKPPARMMELYEVVKRAQEKAIKACRPGVTTQELYNVAMKVIEKAGFGDAFLHGLGHGLGLDVHEYPILRRDPKPTILEAGMVLTIEPGIYLPEIGGVRLEEVVLVTADGCRELTGCPKSTVVAPLQQLPLKIK